MADGKATEAAWPEVMRCPAHFVASIREKEPVYQLPDRPEYLLTRYDDVVWAARHPERFSSKRVLPRDQDPDIAEIAAEGYPTPPTIVDNDRPAALVYREAGFRAFSPRRLAAYEPRIRELANALIDDFIDHGAVDFVREFADEFPMRVMVDLLDLPGESVDQLKRWVRDWTELIQGYAPKARALRLQRSVVEFEKFLAAEIESRRAAPREDVLSEFVQSKVESVPFELPHLVAITKIFLTAGTANTGGMIANAMWLLLKDGDALRRVTDDPTLIPMLLEETLRVESPSQWAQRRCTVDTDIGGTVIPAGARVFLVWAAANRDASHFHDSDRFQLERKGVRSHLGFGSGPHTCVGAPLARLEGRAALDEFLSRVRNITIANPDATASWVQRAPTHRRLTELRLQFDTPGDLKSA